MPSQSLKNKKATTTKKNLIQLSAVDKSIKSLANLILDKHMHTCLIEHIENKDYEIIDEIVDLFRRFQ